MVPTSLPELPKPCWLPKTLQGNQISQKVGGNLQINLANQNYHPFTCHFRFFVRKPCFNKPPYYTQRYPTGGGYGPHTDCSERGRGDPAGVDIDRKVTVLVYLSDTDGGDGLWHRDSHYWRKFIGGYTRYRCLSGIYGKIRKSSAKISGGSGALRTSLLITALELLPTTPRKI